LKETKAKLARTCFIGQFDDSGLGIRNRIDFLGRTTASSRVSLWRHLSKPFRL